VGTAAQTSITSLGTLGSLAVTANITGGNINTAGQVTAGGNVSGANLGTTGLITATGNVTGGNLNTAGLVSVGTTVSATGNITGGNIRTAGSVSATGDITGGNLTVTNTVIGGNLTVTGTTAFTNVTTLAIQDPIISIGRGANNAPLISNDSKDRGEQLYYYDTSEKSAFIGYLNGSGKLVAATATTITNELVTINTYGSFVVGQLEGATVSVTGNITGGNVVGGANVNATTHTGSTVSVSGSINGGNVISAGVISGTGNITGGNVTTAGLTSTASLSVTGNTATVTSANYTIGYRDIPQLTGFGTLASTDGGKHYYGTGTITIPTNASVPLAVGTAILVIASGATTISSGSITLVWAGVGTTGSRTLAQYGQASLIKVAENTWYISGTGLT
jgi:hypothetical protein